MYSLAFRKQSWQHDGFQTQLEVSLLDATRVLEGQQLELVRSTYPSPAEALLIKLFTEPGST